MLDVGGGPGGEHRRERADLALPAPARRGLSSDTVTRSAYAPGTISPASGQPRHARPLADAATARPAALKWPRRRETVPSRSLQPAGLGEQVDGRMAVAAQAEGAPGRRQRGGGADPVGEVGLGQRAHAHGALGVAQQRDVSFRQVGRVHHSGPRAEHPGVLEHFGWRLAPAAWVAVFSRGCSDRWTWTGAPWWCDQAMTSGICSGGTARTEWIGRADPGVRPSMPRSSYPKQAIRVAQAAAVPSPNRRCTPASGRGLRPARRPPDSTCRGGLSAGQRRRRRQ